MKTPLARGFALSLPFVASTALLQAHPGHEGHELTWDFSHLAAHPLATFGGFGVLLTAGAVGWYLIRRSTHLR